MQYNKGFTLVELLVVIGIIGIIAGVSVAGLGVVRAKARDTKRIEELNTLAKHLVSYAEQNSMLPLTGCVVAGVSITDCAKPEDPAPALPFDFASYQDPSGALRRNALCDNSSSEPCQYSVDKANPTADNFQFCLYLETDQSSFGKAGPHKIVEGGLISSGCDH